MSQGEISNHLGLYNDKLGFFNFFFARFNQTGGGVIKLIQMEVWKEVSKVLLWQSDKICTCGLLWPK